MFPQQPFAEQGMYGTQPYNDGFFPQQPQGFYQPPHVGQIPGPKPGFPQGPMGQPGLMGQPGPLFGDDSYNLDARLDRIEREIVEINRRLNTLSRRVRRIENFLNIRDDL